jgi:hypothetical protein
MCLYSHLHHEDIYQSLEPLRRDRGRIILLLYSAISKRSRVIRIGRLGTLKVDAFEKCGVRI